MYCIQCGVELADSEAKCPLCGLEPYHPKLKRVVGDKTYPDTVAVTPRNFKRFSIMFLFTGLVAFTMLMLMVIDFSVNHTMSWSAYVMLTIALVYVILFLPMWFNRPNAVVFMSVDVATVGVYLAVLNILLNGNWYFSFAFPMVLIFGAISITIVTISKYVRKGFLYLSGGGFIALGVAMIVMEILLNITFDLSKTIRWSFIPLVGCSIIGLMLILIAIIKPLRETLTKKLFI